jgi:hypothetical protein
MLFMGMQTDNAAVNPTIQMGSGSSWKDGCNPQWGVLRDGRCWAKLFIEPERFSGLQCGGFTAVFASPHHLLQSQCSYEPLR